MADIASITTDELSLADDMLMARQSFRVIAVKSMLDVTADLEHKIEKLGLKCRVYTENRSASLALGLIPTGVTTAVAIGSAVGILVHNIATFNPDYEVIKNFADNSIKVRFKK